MFYLIFAIVAVVCVAMAMAFRDHEAGGEGWDSGDGEWLGDSDLGGGGGGGGDGGGGD